ncbi:hypothetical protein ACFT5B_00200 [Luteimicrobium sp. NPDC057192]|uniref:hypothetical protein n=1 Tax=Luteimicrobium sp. NPDC057192 TaxID=3346042 RepID=UPI00362C9A53
MDFVIVSNAATDIVGVGADRAEVRRALGTWRSFRRAPLSGESDQFVEAGVTVTYAEDGSAVVLEFMEPARVVVEGIQLIGQRLESVLDGLESAV